MSKVTYDFSGENYAVTGASSGIGRQIALELAESGANVLAIGRNVERLDGLKAECPGRIFPASLDVCDASALEGAVAGFVDVHGKLSGGVHAAGIGDLTPIRSYDKDKARAIMNVSFWAGVDFIQIVAKAKYGKAGTSTVLFSSVASITHEKGQFAYSAAKSAVDTAVRSIAKEVHTKHHRVNSIISGWVTSPMTEEFYANYDTDVMLKKHLLGAGKPEYISKMVLFLLSDASCWITGSNIVVDGGYSA